MLAASDQEHQPPNPTIAGLSEFAGNSQPKLIAAERDPEATDGFGGLALPRRVSSELARQGRSHVPRLSIVIPCLGGAAEFDETLVSVLQNRPSRCEVLVVHAQPYDDPYGLKDEVRFIRVSGRPSLVQLANTGLEAAQGDIVHLLGCRLSTNEGWTETALEHFDDEAVAAVSPLIVDAVHGQVAAAGVNCSLAGSRQIVGRGVEIKNTRRVSRLQAAGPTLDAGFYRREVLLALGGWQETLSEVADADLAQSLAALELKTVVDTDCVLHERSPALRQGGFAHGRALERLFWRQASVGQRGLAILLHMLAVMVDFTLRVPKGDAVTTLIGRAVGILHAGKMAKYATQLAEARALLAGEEPSTLSLADAREELNEATVQTTQRRKAA